jgi:hypothetical protein
VEALGRWKNRTEPHAEADDYVFAENGVPLHVERYRRKARTWNLGELGCLYGLTPELAEAEPTVRIRPGLPLKFTARVAKLADAADLGSQGTPLESPSVQEISPIGDPRPHEIAPEQPAEWQSSGNQKRLAELDAAIANVTRLLAETDDVGAAAELVGERRAMRLEHEMLRRTRVQPAEQQSSGAHEGFALPSAS